MGSKTKVVYDIGRSGRKYYFYKLPSGAGGTLSQEDYEDILNAFVNPELRRDFRNGDLPLPERDNA